MLKPSKIVIKSLNTLNNVVIVTYDMGQIWDKYYKNNNYIIKSITFMSLERVYTGLMALQTYGNVVI